MAVCPYCKDIVVEQEAWICPVCESAHHRECWESNMRFCSVYGCKSTAEETLLGCPFCEEVAPGAATTCPDCGQRLMNGSEIAEFLNSHTWEMLPADNPVLTAGYLRNSGVLARLSKKPPVSMLGLGPKITLWVPAEQRKEAQTLLETLSERYKSCPECGLTLFIDEDECSYCRENSGAEA